MRYLALATDFDSTIAHDGVVDEATLQALVKVRESGRKLILVTGRELDDLRTIFAHLDLFDHVVAENGALLYRPGTREEKLLTDPPPERFIQTLKRKGVPLSAGRAIVATVEPYQQLALEAIQELGLELHLIFNKGAVMVLPSGINKSTGLEAALAELGLSPHNVVGIGDAENDHAFLAACGAAVAVANALPALKERADWVTRGARGAGVIELAQRLLKDDLADVVDPHGRHAILIGYGPSAEERLDPLATNLLVAGTSGSGKSTLTTGILERLASARYQYAIIDPEGDYAGLEGAVMVGDAEHAPPATAAVDVLKKPGDNTVINLLAVPLEDRPKFFNELLPHLLELRGRTGRPHFIVVDEAHHLLPAERGPKPAAPPPPTGMLYITVHPESLAPSVLQDVGVLLVVGQKPAETIGDFCRVAGRHKPKLDSRPLAAGEVLLWRIGAAGGPTHLASEPPRGERRRHSRKYAQGNLGAERNFVFTGPEGKLNLRAQNLAVFVQLAEGVDDDTWQHHLRRGDYSAWFRQEIKDEELANETADIEGQADQLPPAETRSAICAAVKRRYTLPADKPSGEVNE